MEELFKQGFPVKTCSALPILATIFFWSANIKAVCERQPCRGQHLREVEAIQLLTALILWQKHLAVDLTIRETQPHSALPAEPSWADCSGRTRYWEERKWERACFSHWLKISQSDFSRGVPGGSESLLLLSGRRLWVPEGWPVNLSAPHHPESVPSTRNTNSTFQFHVREHRMVWVERDF